MYTGNPGRIDPASYHLFSDSYRYYAEYRVPTRIRLIRYDLESMESIDIPTGTADFRELVRDGFMHWIQVTGLTDWAAIGRLLDSFEVMPIDHKSILTPDHAAKVDDLTDRLLVVLDSCIFEAKGNVTSEHIAIVSKNNVVISFRERDRDTFSVVEDRIRNNVMDIRTEQRGMLVAFLLNAVLSETIGTALKVERMLEKLDDILLDAHHNISNMGRRIQECRHANLMIQKNTTPLKKEFPKLMKTDIVKNDQVMTLVYNELYNQLDFIELTSANSKELLASMRDLYGSNNDLRLNSVMKRLTVVSTLFIPITFLVGFWGMNFRFMPETEWKYGYLLAVFMIAVTAWSTWKFMKKDHWF